MVKCTVLTRTQPSRAEPWKSSGGTLKRLVTIAALCLSFALTTPYIAGWQDISVPDFMFWRGVMTVIAVWLYCWVSGIKIQMLEGVDLLAGITFCLVTFCFAQAVRTPGWGVEQTVVVMCLTPLLNMTFALFRGEAPSKSEIFLALSMIAGAFLCQIPRGGLETLTLNQDGLGWTAATMLVTATYSEILGSAGQRNSDPSYLFSMVMWQGVILIPAAFTVANFFDTRMFNHGNEWLLYLALVGLVSGFVSFLSQVNLFRYYSRPNAAALMLLQVPAVLVANHYINKTVLSPTQTFGIMLTVLAAIGLALSRGQRQAGQR